MGQTKFRDSAQPAHVVQSKMNAEEKLVDEHNEVIIHQFKSNGHNNLHH